MNINGTLSRLFLQRYKNDISVGETKKLTPSGVGQIIIKKFNGKVGVTFNDLSYVAPSEGFLKNLQSTSFWKRPSFDYQEDVSDCEDYAHFINSLVGLLWKTNTLGVAYGRMKIGNNWYNHAFCLPIVIRNGEPIVYMYDPLYDIMIEANSNIVSADGYSWEIQSVEYY